MRLLMKHIINLTPHALSLHGESGIINVPPSGTVARLAVTRQALSPVTVDGVVLSVNRPTLGEVTDLPAPQDGTIFVASALVAEAAGRADVMSPGELVRDDAGRPVGARGLCSYFEEDSK